MTQTTLRDYLLTTEDAISSGRINDALTNCQYILTHFPESLEAQRLLGEVYLAQGQLDEAQQTFDWVLTNDPENVIVYCDRALISEQLQDYDTALDCYQQAYELSRGNSEIRREFNQLSEKVGQTGFIFSRAGLARLYMRGDLLPQAIQEWEIVLSTNPERLDARTGLLETLWREGLYYQVEQLATQILNDVPGCLKAILLLAHVTFVQNAMKSQELMRLAETLDPDFIKAQELFSDFVASLPKDPFLSLLKKTPTTFPAATNGSHITPSLSEQTTGSMNKINGTNGSHSTTPFADPLVRWGNLDNIIEPQQEYQPAQESIPFGNWTDASTVNFDGWSAFAQQPTQSTPTPPFSQPTTNNNQAVPSDTPVLDSQYQVQQSEEAHNELSTATWQMPPSQAVEKTNETPLAQQNSQEQTQPWHHSDVSEEPTFDSWNKGENLTQTSSDASWGMNEQESETPTPPAWLDMLTSEHHQPASPTPPVQPTTTSASSRQTPIVPPLEQPEPVSQEEDISFAWSDQQSTHSTTSPFSQPSLDDEEPFFFGPEWLKSLGATSIESGMPQNMLQEEEDEKTTPSTLEVQPLITEQPPLQEQPLLAETQPELLPTSSSEENTPATTTPIALETTAETPKTPIGQDRNSVENWLDRAAQLLAQPQQNILTTLEELENDLRSQGFTPLEPGALSSFASDSETDEAALSSALAQFGNLEPQPQAANEAIPAQPVQQNTPIFSPSEPLWAPPDISVQPGQDTPQPVYNQVAEAPQQVQQTQPVQSAQQTLQSRQQPVIPHHLDALSTFASQSTPIANKPSEPVRADSQSNNVAAQAIPNITSSIAPPATSNVRSDLPLDTELETTMKRPAMRLQPTQQRYGGQPGQAVSSGQWGSGQSGQNISKGRSGERSTTGNTSAGSLGHKERLVRGYQYQLAGSYDEAMQEYRFIIRNAPDLLSEVVSNMRALLKIAPKYAAGYRVLGDAYMRQGEYLQAMEAYNKALSMAKKGKS